jgi:ABC-2 type transport system ATP-binding protein
VLVSDTVVEVHGLRKEFSGRQGKRVAVADLDLHVLAGEVHGFLGPNGSGKTTTIRMLLGLARASAGSMALFGRAVPEHLPEVVGRVGAVVESPKFSPNFSGRRNLLLLARSVGVPDDRVESALATVGLTDRAGDRYRSYSLGMKQRLAIAATLLKDPALLILDEPTNGLDPAGIREVREVIRGLGEAGVTVLLSSHILAEVQQVCSTVTILGQGRTLASGTVAELVAGGFTHRVVTADPVASATALAGAGITVVSRDGDALVVESDDPTDISRALGQAGLWVRELAPVGSDLESVFLRLTEGTELGGKITWPTATPRVAPETGSGS